MFQERRDAALGVLCHREGEILNLLPQSDRESYLAIKRALRQIKGRRSNVGIVPIIEKVGMDFDEEAIGQGIVPVHYALRKIDDRLTRTTISTLVVARRKIIEGVLWWEVSTSPGAGIPNYLNRVFTEALKGREMVCLRDHNDGYSLPVEELTRQILLT